MRGLFLILALSELQAVFQVPSMFASRGDLFSQSSKLLLVSSVTAFQDPLLVLANSIFSAKEFAVVMGRISQHFLQ